MSATGRNNPGSERRADDNYATPDWCTHAILPFLPQGCVLDPCCGEGAILDAARPLAANRHAICGIELDGLRAAKAMHRGFSVLHGDALTMGWPEETGVIVTNPPYSHALAFVFESLRQFPKIDKAFLLRLNFLGSQKRAAFHRANPSDIFVLPRRPSFTGGGTDATEYAWFVWGPAREGRVRILDV